MTLEPVGSGVVANHKEQGKADSPCYQALNAALLENRFFGRLVNVAHDTLRRSRTIPQPVSSVNG